MRIAVAQVHPPTADPLAAVEKLRWLLGGLRAAAAAADLLVLPEAWLQAYHLSAALAHKLAAPLPLAADAGGSPLERVAALAAEFGVAVALGFVERYDCRDCAASPPCAATVYNSLALIDGAGRLVACYRKTHLWGADERAILSPGPAAQCRHRQGSDASPSSRDDAPAPPARAPSPAFAPVRLPAFPDTPIGLLVCFDMEFAEPSRLLALAGAKLVIASTAMCEREAFASRLHPALPGRLSVARNYDDARRGGRRDGALGLVVAAEHLVRGHQPGLPRV
jgi:predicted amidohydrolase